MGYDTNSADKDKAWQRAKLGSKREVDQVPNTRDIWLERRETQIKVHSPA